MGTPRIKSTDFIGQRFGRLLITDIEVIRERTCTRSVATAVCDCGKVKKYFFGSLKRGLTKSCGCLNSETAQAKHKQMSPVNGLSKHSLYRVWSKMLRRCHDAKDIRFKDYGARGVVVCNEWKNCFIAFYNWAIANGWQPGLQLDKDIKGNSKLYSPDTCIFVTPKENMRARSCNNFIEYNGEIKPLSEWCEILKMKYTTIRRRLRAGMKPAEAFTKLKYA